MYVYIYILYMYSFMKTMYPPGYHRKGFVATHALEQPYIMCQSA